MTRIWMVVKARLLSDLADLSHLLVWVCPEVTLQLGNLAPGVVPMSPPHTHLPVRNYLMNIYKFLGLITQKWQIHTDEIVRLVANY